MGWLQRLFGDKTVKTAEDAPPSSPSTPPIAPQSAQHVSDPAAQARAPVIAKPVTASAAAPNKAVPNAAVPNAAVPNASTPSAKGDAYGASWEQRNDANANFNDWLFESNDSSDFETTPAENDILEALDKLVKGKQSGANLVKRMPGVIPQLLQNLRSENFSGAELSRKISHDVVLVAAVIRIANSSLYNPTQTITSIEHAVLLLGQNGLRQLITGVAFRPIIDLHSGYYTKSIAPRIWDQSERCALASKILAEEKEVDPFDAFLAGLVQHVGLVVALRIMDQTTNGRAQIGTPPFCSALLRHTRALSCSIAREWNFPDSVSLAIEEQAGFNTAKMSQLGKVLALGDYLAKVRILVDHNRLTEGDPRVLKGLSPLALQAYRELLEAEIYDPLAEHKN